MDEFVVSTEWLEANLDRPDLKIIDIRGHVIDPDVSEIDFRSHYVDYVDQHIPGAVYLDWITEICDDAQHLRIANVAKFEAAMDRIGLTPDRYVVAYDDTNNVLAARLWWALNYYGHPQVAILDGGWNKWLAEGRPVTADMPEIETTSTFTARSNNALRTQGHEVLYALNSSTVLLDVRSESEFRGEDSLADMSGHIPGAVNLPIEELTRPDATLLPPDEMRAKFASVGIDDSTPEVIIYSNTGVAACLGLLAMRVAGFSNGSVYDTSWLEWGNDEKKPVETVEQA